MQISMKFSLMYREQKENPVLREPIPIVIGKTALQPPNQAPVETINSHIPVF